MFIALTNDMKIYIAPRKIEGDINFEDPHLWPFLKDCLKIKSKKNSWTFVTEGLTVCGQSYLKV